jgi:hypothetical protein
MARSPLGSLEGAPMSAAPPAWPAEIAPLFAFGQSFAAAMHELHVVMGPKPWGPRPPEQVTRWGEPSDPWIRIVDTFSLSDGGVLTWHRAVTPRPVEDRIDVTISLAQPDGAT